MQSKPEKTVQFLKSCTKPAVLLVLGNEILQFINEAGGIFQDKWFTD